VLTVDHGLNPDSRNWARAVAEAAERLGRPSEVLRWTGEKPATSLPAAARAARHALLAEAARGLGARVLLMGHTADDVLEGEAMRDEGSTLGRLREWAPSPAWPEGRGVFVLRPLLRLRRAELRKWLGARGVSWVEDPANADPRFARSRARAALAAEGKSLGPGFRRDEREGETAGLASRAEADRFGVLRIARRDLQLASEGTAVRFLGAWLLCAAGGSRPPRGRRLERLAARLSGEEGFTATLAGARVQADETVTIGRDAGERARGGLRPVAVEPGRPAVWDGRFEVTSASQGTVQALGGLAARLPEAQRAALKAAPGWLRPALPAFVEPEGEVSCPVTGGPARACSLVAERLLAACGVITRERELP
jgi:tRNA(Ile)-lysidine synthase